MNRSYILTLLLMLTPAVLAGGPSHDKLLARVPDDAALVVFVPSLEKLTQGLAAFGKATGVRELEQMNTEELLSKVDPLNGPDGLNTAGAFLIATSPSGGEPILLCGVSDAAAWKAKANPTDATDGLMKLGSDYASLTDDVLVISEETDQLKAAAKSTGKLAERFRKTVGALTEKNQVVIYVDMPPWKDAIDGAFETMETFAEAGMAMSGQAPSPSGMAMFKWMSGEIRKYLAESRTHVFALRFGGDGVFLAASASFKADGDVAGFLKKVHKPEGDLLRGLPEQPAMAVFGFDWAGAEGKSGFSDGMVKALASAVEPKDAQQREELDAALKSISEMNSRWTGMNGMMVSVGETHKAFVGHYFTRAPKALLGDFDNFAKIGPLMTRTFDAGITATSTVAHEKIGSNDVVVCKTEYAGENAPSIAAMKSMYGDSMVLLATEHDGTVAYVTGPAEGGREQLGKLLDAKVSAYSGRDDVKKAVATLSPKPQALVLLDAPKAVEWVTSMAAGTGAPVTPMKIPTTAALFSAAGLYVEDAAIRAELSLPAEMLKSIIEASKSAGARQY